MLSDYRRKRLYTPPAYTDSEEMPQVTNSGNAPVTLSVQTWKLVLEVLKDHVKKPLPEGYIPGTTTILLRVIKELEHTLEHHK